MKKLFIGLYIVFGSLNCFALSEDSKVILTQMDKRFEQINKKIDLMNEKIDQNTKLIRQNGGHVIRIDATVAQIEKHYDFLQNLVFVILAGVFGVPMYYEGKRSREDSKTKDSVKDILVALREQAQDDPKVKRSLDVAGIKV